MFSQNQSSTSRLPSMPWKTALITSGVIVGTTFKTYTFLDSLSCNLHSFGTEPGGWMSILGSTSSVVLASNSGGKFGESKAYIRVFDTFFTLKYVYFYIIVYNYFLTLFCHLQDLFYKNQEQV